MGSVPHDDHIHEHVDEPLRPQPTQSTAAKSRQQSSNALRIAIVGGGIGGLCTALGLLKHNHIDVQIYEAAHKFSEIGAGIGVGPNAENALELLGPDVYAAYAKQATRCPFRICNGQAKGKLAGETLTSADSTASQSTVHRAQFLDALVELVPAERAHFGKRLERLEDEGGKLTLHFKDGTSVEADGVIGADGIHSHTRDYVLDDLPDKEKYGPTFSGATAYRNLIPMEKVVEAVGAKIAQYSTLFILDGSMVLTYPVDHSARLNVVAYTWKYKEWTDPKWVIPVTNEEVLSSYHGQDARLSKLLSLMEKPAAWALWDLLDIPKYNRGCVCIMGDAAHAPTPFHGQGAGQAIEDALTLSDLFGTIKAVEDIPCAFAAYDTIRRPRGNRNAVDSRTSGKVGSLLDPDHTDVKEIADGFAPRMMWLWTKDMKKQSQEAIDLFQELKSKAS